MCINEIFLFKFFFLAILNDGRTLAKWSAVRPRAAFKDEKIPSRVFIRFDPNILFRTLYCIMNTLAININKNYFISELGATISSFYHISCGGYKRELLFTEQGKEKNYRED